MSYIEIHLPGRRAGLPEGPWLDEPDKIQWYDQATQMACLIVRNPVGVLCGYVGVEPSHPWHGVAYNECIKPGACDCESVCDHRPGSILQVHGGINYSTPCQEDGEVCHVPTAGREHNIWWFGFDCGHAWDLIPRYIAKGWYFKDVQYRDVEYVKNQCADLAYQLAQYAP